MYNAVDKVYSYLKTLSSYFLQVAVNLIRHD